MPSDRKLRKFVRQWHKRYPHPVDWVDNRANKLCQKSETEWLAQFQEATVLRRRQVMALIDWRFANREKEREIALKSLSSPSDSGHTKRCIKRALGTASPISALDCLLDERDGVSGWGPVMSSTVLAACRPKIYPFAEVRCLRTLEALDLYSPRLGGEFTRDDWWPYLRICRRLSSVSALTLQGVAQALWAAADGAPKLPGTGRTSRG